MTLLSKYISQCRGILHDLAGNDWTDPELIGHINAARTRVALDTHCVRTYLTNLQAMTQVESYPMNGGVMGAVITNQGTGYANGNMTITPSDGNGSGAVGSGTVTAGKITAVTFTNPGSGYTAPPVLAFTGGGSNATATAIVPLNIIDILQVAIIWGNIQRYVLSWFPWTPFNAFCRSNTLAFARPGAWTMYQEQSQVFIANIPDQNYAMEWDAITLPTDMSDVTKNDTQIFPPFDDAVQWYASHLAMIKMQNFAQSEYLNKKYEARVVRLIQTRQDRRDPNVYKTWWRRMRRM